MAADDILDILGYQGSRLDSKLAITVQTCLKSNEPAIKAIDI